MKNKITLLTIVSILLSSTSLFAQQTAGPGESSARAGLGFAQNLAKENAVDKTVQITRIEIAGKIIDAPNYLIDGTIFYTVSGKTFSCAIDNIELTLRERVRLCEDGREYYPVITADSDSKSTRLYVQINDTGLIYDSPVTKGSVYLAPASTSADVQQSESWLGVKMEGGPF